MNRQAFINFYQYFKTTDLWAAMAATVENSPWHREANVAVHTEMVVEQYLKIFTDALAHFSPNHEDIHWNWNRESNAMLGALACLFHDTGKPAAKEEKFKPERGTYYSFAGHEIISARLFEDFIVTHWNDEIVRQLELQPQDIYTIGWMIEHHLPYQLKGEKLQSLRQTAGYSGIFDCVLRADARGRTSDDHQYKLANVESWIKDFNEVPITEPTSKTEDKTVWLLIGASGSGKSTLVKTLSASFGKVAIHSMDQLRLSFYQNPLLQTEGEKYSYAFKMSTEDSSFNSKVSKDYTDMLKAGTHVIVDNTNLTNKRRKMYIAEAKRRGYFVVAVLFPNSLETLINRQNTRGDKSVPIDAVRRQYFSLQYPMLGDVDQVLMQPWEQLNK